MMQTPSRRILVIDDEPGYHDLFRHILGPLGFRVDSAIGGAAGLDLVREQDYCIIFLDMHMPQMRGQEVLKKIVGMRPQQKVVILTSNSSGPKPEGEIEQEVMGLGAMRCFHKPFDIDRILDVVQRFCS